MSLLGHFQEIPILEENEIFRHYPKPCDVAQMPINDVNESEFDVAVIGAGPAGSIAAFHLASRNYKVLMVDGAEFPRNKICGDGLIKDSLDYLGKVGLLGWLEEVSHCNKYIYLTSRKGTTLRGTHDIRVIQRKVLDSKLASHAVDKGVLFARGRVALLSQEKDSVSLKFEDYGREIRAKYAILATGASFRLALKSGLAKSTPSYSAAIRCYVRSKLESVDVGIALCGDKAPYSGWVFPMGNGIFNIGIGHASRMHHSHKIRLHAAQEAFFNTLPAAKELISKADGRTKWLGHPMRCALMGASPLLGERIIATGEVIGTNFPFSGEGVGKAMESAELAAEAVSSALETKDPGMLKAYKTQIDAKLKPKYKGYLLAERWFMDSWRSEIFIKVAQRSTRLRKKVKSFLDETDNPGNVFSAGGVLRNFIGK